MVFSSVIGVYLLRADLSCLCYKVIWNFTLTHTYALCNKKQRGGRPRSSILVLRKEMQEKHLQCIKEPPNAGAGAGVPSASSDSMLLSFVKNSQRAGSTQSIGDGSLKTDAIFAPASSSTDDYLESKPPSLSTNMKNERARRCDFLQELLSTILDDL